MESGIPFSVARDPRALVRFAAGLGGGIVVTAVLFWIMQYLIASADHAYAQAPRGARVDFVRVKRDEVVERRQIKPRKPPPPREPPPEPPTPKLENARPSAEKIPILSVAVRPRIELDGGGFSLAMGEGNYLPIVKVAPIYPQRALSRGIEGECIVEFTVTRAGTTRDVRSVDGQCHRAFEKASVVAASKFKYKPRVSGGKAVEVTGVRNKFTYRLED